MISKDKDLFIVTGLASHGKDTVSELMAVYMDMRFESSSMAALDIFLYDRLKELGFSYADTYAAYEDRINQRELWHEEIAAYNNPKHKLAAAIFEGGNNIYCGMRCNKELLAARQWALERGFRLHVIWVCAYDRLGITESSISNKINPEMADYVLYNDHDVITLEQELIKLIDSISIANLAAHIADLCINRLEPAEVRELERKLLPRLRSPYTADALRWAAPDIRSQVQAAATTSFDRHVLGDWSVPNGA